MALPFGIDPMQLGLEFGTGGVVGALIGFFFKKLAKVVAFIIGAELALFKFLESRGVLIVDWEKLTAGFVSLGESAASATPPSWVMTLLSTLSVSAGFVGGFLLGFRRG